MPTQTILLIICAMLLGGVLSIAHLWNSVRHKRRIARRVNADLSRVLDDYFQRLDKDCVLNEWKDLAQALNVPPERLFPDDTVASWIGSMQLPELHYEQVEIYLKKKGLDPSQFDVNAPIAHIFDAVLLRTCANSPRNNDHEN